MRAKFPIAFAAIVSSCIVTDVRVASSLSLRYGVGGEMEIAVESLTGVNTSKAAAKINLTRENISSYCEHRNVPSGHCASEVVEKIGKELRKEIVADCVGGSWVDMFGHSYSLGGGHIPSGSDQRRIIVVDDVTGEVLDGSRESGFLVQEGIVRMLCPELTDYVIQSMKPHREDNFDPKEKRLAYGSRAGQELTITSETGLDTSKASVKFVHTRKNAKEWCELYLQDNSKACVDKNLASPTPLSLVTGDCMKRTWKDMYGDTYVFLGRNKKATPLTSNDYIIKRVNTNETLDGSSASGYGVQISIFQTLCPKTFEREEQKYIRKSKDWDAVHGLNLSTDRKRTTRIKEEPEVLSDGKENLPHEMSVVTRFRDIREEPEVLGDGKENLPTARSIVDTQGDSILSLQAKSRVPLQNTHGQGDDEELAGKTEDTFSPSAPPKPRLKPIEVLMMAAVNMKLEPASAPPPDPDENLLRTPGKSPNYVIDAESMTETASLEPGAAAKTSLIEEIEGGNVPKDAAIRTVTPDASGDDLFRWPQQLVLEANRTVLRDGEPQKFSTEGSSAVPFLPGVSDSQADSSSREAGRVIGHLFHAGVILGRVSRQTDATIVKKHQGVGVIENVEQRRVPDAHRRHVAIDHEEWLALATREVGHLDVANLSVFHLGLRGSLRGAHQSR